MKTKIISSIVIIAAIAISVGYYMFQKPVESLRDTEAVWEGSSDELFDAFQNDEATGNATYTGKILKVSGVVVETMLNSDSSKTIILSSSHPIFGVKCRLDPDDNDSPAPIKGEKITLKGLCTGINSDVELNQCIIL